MHGNYTMTNQQVPVTEQQRDLGIIITKEKGKRKEKEKMFIQIKKTYYNVYILKLKLSINYFD